MTSRRIHLCHDDHWQRSEMERLYSANRVLMSARGTTKWPRSKHLIDNTREEKAA